MSTVDVAPGASSASSPRGTASTGASKTALLEVVRKSVRQHSHWWYTQSDRLSVEVYFDKDALDSNRRCPHTHAWARAFAHDAGLKIEPGEYAESITGEAVSGALIPAACMIHLDVPMSAAERLSECKKLVVPALAEAAERPGAFAGCSVEMGGAVEKSALVVHASAAGAEPSPPRGWTRAEPDSKALEEPEEPGTVTWVFTRPATGGQATP